MGTLRDNPIMRPLSSGGVLQAATRKKTGTMHSFFNLLFYAPALKIPLVLLSSLKPIYIDVDSNLATISIF